MYRRVGEIRRPVRPSAMARNKGLRDRSPLLGNCAVGRLAEE
jgi:hypothetical protein